MYDALAAFYDRLDDGADKSRWAAWLGELIRRRVGCGEGADLGCGTGAFTRLLQREVTLCCACDRSPAMLNEAAKALRLPLVQADFASFRAPHRLDFLTVVNDGLNYVSFERLPGTLTHLCGQLRAGGALLFDLSTPRKLREVLGDNLFFDDGEDLSMFWQSEWAEDRVRFSLVFFAREGELYRRSEEYQTQYAHRPADVERALKAAGFSQVTCLRMFSEEAPDESDLRVQFVAVK